MVAQAHGIDLTDLRAHCVKKEDYNYYNHIITMDEINLNNMLSGCKKYNQRKLKLLLEYADDTKITEVPEPYGEGVTRFLQRLID